MSARRCGWLRAWLARSRSSVSTSNRYSCSSTFRYFQRPSRNARWLRCFMRQYIGREKVLPGSASTGCRSTPSSGYAGSACTPAAASMVAVQSIVIRCWSLTPPGCDALRPARDARHADAAFGQVHLAADERPVVAEALAAVVAREDDQRVVAQTAGVQRIEHAADALVEFADHLVVDVDGSAIEVPERGAGHRRLRGMVARLPRPVRRGVVQAEQERRPIGGARIHVLHRAVAQQVGEVGALVVRPARRSRTGRPCRRDPGG